MPQDRSDAALQFMHPFDQKMIDLAELDEN